MKERVKKRLYERRFHALETMPKFHESTPPFSHSTTDCNYAATDCDFAHRRHAGDRATTDLSGVPYYGYRYYNPGLGRWISQDPIGERGGIHLYGFCHNSPVYRLDALGKRDIPSIKVAYGLTAGGGIVAKLSPFGLRLSGLVAGSQTAIIFFPASCEVGVFSVQAGLGRNLTEWRAVTQDDFPSIREWIRFETGINAGLGVGLEGAVFVGGGLAGADSFEGVFHTAQGAVGVGLSGYVGDVDDKGRLWTGGTMTVGPGVGLAKIDWMYRHHGNVVDLDDNFGVPGRCMCLWMRKKVAGLFNAIRYF